MKGLPRTELTDLIDNLYEVCNYDEDEAKLAALDLYIKGVKDGIDKAKGWVYLNPKTKEELVTYLNDITRTIRLSGLLP